MKLNKPILDMPTRWNSTLDMLVRLLEHKDICTEHLNNPLKEEDWQQIEELVSVLKPVQETTLKLQEEQLLMGDFFRAWLYLKIKLQAIDTSMSLEVLHCILAREPQLLDTEVMNAAIFLDPRVRRTLSSAKKESAKQHLKKLAFQMLSLKKINQPNVSELTEPSTSHNFAVDESSNMSCTTLLRATLKGLEVESSSDEENCSSSDVIKAYAEIDGFKEKNHIDIEVNLMSYWQEKKYSLPYLYKLAKIVHATPATQVSVERAFSALKLVLSDLRCNISEETLQSIMLVKLNKI